MSNSNTSADFIQAAMGNSNSNLSHAPKDERTNNCAPTDDSDEQDFNEIVVGLYLGASVCGFGYCPDIAAKSPEITLSEDWHNEYGTAYNTTPIAMLYTKDQRNGIKPFKFGYDAINTYKRADKPEDYFLCETYKSAFDQIFTVDNQSFAVEMFMEHVLDQLRDKVVNLLRKKRLMSKKYEDPLKWIISYPVTMNSTGVSIDSFEKIVYQVLNRPATLISENFGAALCCLEMPIYGLTGVANQRLPAGTICGVIDLKSEYFSLFKKNSGIGAVETMNVISVRLDLEDIFMKLLCEQFDPEDVVDFKRTHIRTWSSMLSDFKIQMRGFKDNRDTTISFKPAFDKSVKKAKKPQQIEYENENFSYDNDSLLINSGYFRKIFDQFAMKLLHEITGVPKVKTINYLFLIGWSSVLEGSILKEKKKRGLIHVEKVKIHQNSNACALKGTILAGKYLSN